MVRFETWSETDSHGESVFDIGLYMTSFQPHDECFESGNTALSPSYIYAIADDTGRTLYIGVSKNPMSRLKSHSNAHGWARTVNTLAAIIGVGCCRRHAMQMERHLQRSMRPTHNRIKESINP